MGRNLFLMLVAASVTTIAATSACSDDDNPPSSTGTGAQEGAAQTGGGGTGGGHGGSCKGCGDLLSGKAVAAAELCGFQGHGDGGSLVCDPNSSCQKLEDLTACTCGDGRTPGACNEPMGNNACETNACTVVRGADAGTCGTCIIAACGVEFRACSMDTK